MLDLNLTPPEEHEDEMINGQDAVNENDQDAVIEEHAAAGVGAQQAKKTRKTLSDTQKYAAYVALHALCMKGGGNFDKEDMKNIANFFEVGIRQIQSLWQRAMKQIEEGLPVDVSSRRKGRCGRKPLEIDLSRIPSIPLNKRSTIRSLAWQLGVNPTTLFRKFEMNLIRRHSNALTPPLTEKHKRNRAQFCLGMVDEDTIATADPLFIDMYRIVHVDEKWFNMTVNDKVYYLLPDEPDPKRPVAGNCIGKVMFLTAVARPRYDSEGKMTFDGKIGMWPFVKEVPAQRRSQNREKGTLETKNLVVTREVMREYFIEKLLPAIELLWPQEDVGKTIFIQQDNAKPHLLPNDPAFAEAVANSRFKIKLIQQPANSPDLNVLDLGFFRSIQSLTNTLSSKTLKEFIKGVEAEFRAYESSKLNRIFLSLMSVMVEVMNNLGENGLKLVHANKDKRERLGQLPIRLRCPPEVIAHTLNFLGQAQDVA